MEASHPAVTSDARSDRVPMAEHRVASFSFESATAKQATFQVAPSPVRRQITDSDCYHFQNQKYSDRRDMFSSTLLSR